MIKSELVQRISAQNPHLYQRDVENIVNAILGEIIAAMARGDRVELRGFGAFSVKQRPARTGRNPRTGAHVVGRPEMRAVLQDRQGNARAAQSGRPEAAGQPLVPDARRRGNRAALSSEWHLLPQVRRGADHLVPLAIVIVVVRGREPADRDGLVRSVQHQRSRLSSADAAAVRADHRCC